LINPSFGTVANEIGNDGQAGQYGIYVQRNIVRNNRVVEIENAFHWKIKSLSHRYDFVQRRIGRQLGRLYVEYDFQRKMIALTSARITEVSKIKDYAETLIKVGEIGTLEFTRIEIELARQSQRRELFRGNLEKTRAGILSYLSSDLETVIPDFDLESQSDLLLKEPEPADVKSSSISHQMTLSFADHPQKIALLDELEQLKWLVRYARSQQQPDLQWQTSLNIDTASDDLFAGFQLNVPWLVNDRKIGSIKSAQAGVQSKIEEVDQLVRALRRKQTKWLMQKNVAAASMRSIRQKVIPLTDRNLVNTTKVFRAGETGYLELRQALEVGYEVRENLLEALQDFLVGHIELESLVIE
jgi:outer membrane protein TolC